jgi:DNA-binding NarL/FixJ family response regulator
VVAEAANGREAIVLADYQHPEIILLDIQLPHVSGIAAAREIASKKVAARIIFVSTLIDGGYIQEAFKAGALGYVLADEAQTDLPLAIATVAKGGAFLSPTIIANLLDEYGQKTGLTKAASSDQDRQLFCWLSTGQNEQDIARNLNMNTESVRLLCESLWNRLHHSGLPSALLNSIQAHSIAASMIGGT